MAFPISNRALFRSMLAGAVVLAACSRSDRDESGRQTTGAVTTDTVSDATTQPGATPDTGMTTGTVTDTGSAAPANTPRANTATPQRSADTTAGYRGMERDTAGQGGEPARVSEDTSETSMNTADTSVAGYSEMARDTTSTTPEQADTVSSAQGDVALEAKVDTAHADSDVNAEAGQAGETDTAAIQARVDTTAEQTEVAVQNAPDTVTVVGDTSSVDKPGPRAKEDTVSSKADSLAQYHEAERVRPPEDSTEVAASEAPGDEVGAARIPGGEVTGAEAVGLVTRGGAQCIVVDPETNEAVRWDMSSTPATLNPCGLGSMNLSKIWSKRIGE